MPLLRSRLSKRTSEQTQEKKEKKAKKPSSSPFLAAIDHLHRPQTANKEAMDSTPTPPKHLTVPRDPEKARSSPSKSLLERYKHRAPASKIPVTPPSSERTATLAMRPKKPAFTENFENEQRSPAASSDSNATLPVRPKIPAVRDTFGNVKRALASPAPQSEVTTSPSKPTIRKVSGVDFQMLSASDSSNSLRPRSKSAEPARAHSRSDDDGEDSKSTKSEHRRVTRSQSRRKERTDSTTGTTDTNPTSPTKTVTASTGKAESPKPESPRPRATLIKKRKSDPSVKAKHLIPRADRTILDLMRRQEQGTGDTTPTKLPHRQPTVNSDSSHSSDSDSNSSCEFILDSTAGQVGQTHNRMTYRSEDDEDEFVPIEIPTRVVPPAAIASDLPGMVWISNMSGTSRPHMPWLWCKRWTCCRCSGTTIVEQAVCSRLICGHRRCGGRCCLTKERKMGPL